ncbi:MAG TPA: hypothetical protein PK899_04635 [Spirochaetota bacterium]|nr:hypothetical protein [Spirochaetota bacterium]
MCQFPSGSDAASIAPYASNFHRERDAAHAAPYVSNSLRERRGV